MIRFRLIFIAFLLIFSISQAAQTQVGDEKVFNKYRWEKFDFTKKKVTKAQFDKLQYNFDDIEIVNELAIVRGIFFGKRGRIFIGRSIQDYLEKQSWYKRNPSYSPSVLSAIERKNLEKLSAKKEQFHNTAVSVGDMDKFQNALLTRELLDSVNLNKLRLMRLEFYARRGRIFKDKELR